VTRPRQRFPVLAVVIGSLLASRNSSPAAPDAAPANPTPPAAPDATPANPEAPPAPVNESPPSGDQAAAAGRPVRIDPRDDDGVVRLSLPTEEDRTAWQRSGFRLALGALYGRLRGSGEVPDLTLTGVVIRPGIRIDPQWSIYVPLQYAVTDHRGARFAAAVEPTWHATPGIALGFGVGYAGLVGINTYGDVFGSGPEDDLGMLGQPYTFPDAKTPLSECTGVGITALARVELGYVLGRRSRTHIALEALGQWTGCEESTFRRDSFTGVEYVFRQWWGHAGMSLSWGIEWR
jgi:hypothetical protein